MAKRLAFSDNKVIRIVDTTSGVEILALPPFKSGTLDVLFSHDGTQLTVASAGWHGRNY